MSPEEGAVIGILFLLVCPLIAWRFQETLAGINAKADGAARGGGHSKRTSGEGGSSSAGRSKPRKGGKKKADRKAELEAEKARLTEVAEVELPESRTSSVEFEFELDI